MSSYRDILYQNYSAAFAEQKVYDPAVQYASYEARYHYLPKSKQITIGDLGCGKGEWLSWLHSKGYDNLAGVDGSASDLALARRHGSASVQWHQADLIAFLESRPNSFDLLHAKDVVEHLTKDEFLRFLQAAHGALRPGGKLWLLTFNAQSPLSTATRYGDFTHEIGMTPASFAQCLRACQFSHIHVKGIHYCSSSFSGRVRGLLSCLFYAACSWVLKLRHGSDNRDSRIELYTALPDLFVEAVKD